MIGGGSVSSRREFIYFLDFCLFP